MLILLEISGPNVWKDVASVLGIKRILGGSTALLGVISAGEL